MKGFAGAAILQLLGGVDDVVVVDLHESLFASLSSRRSQTAKGQIGILEGIGMFVQLVIIHDPLLNL